MSTQTAPAAPWWQEQLDQHTQRDGRCPVCGTRKRCWPWAEAFAARTVAEMEQPCPV